MGHWNYFEYLPLNEHVASITNYFGNDTHLEFPSIIGNYKITGISDYAFYNYKNKQNVLSVKFGENIRVIGDYAFSDFSNLEFIDFGQVSMIKGNAFEGCIKLRNIEIPGDLGSGAFKNCYSLEKITINSNTNIMPFIWLYYPFEGCRSLKTINVSPKTHELASVDGILFNKDKTTLICYPPARSEQSYVIPNTVSHIHSEAFLNCKNIIEVRLPQNLLVIGSSSFKGCSNIRKIVILT